MLVRNCTAPFSALFVLAIAPALAAESANAVVAPADAFLAALADHCGKAYAGRIVANEPAAAPGAPADPFEGKVLVLRVPVGCSGWSSISRSLLRCRRRHGAARRRPDSILRDRSAGCASRR
jgi:hypothetical protein